jgi:hypothetical protein
MPELQAVVPLIPRDLERFSMLARSLDRNFEDIGKLFVVVPDAARDAMLAPIREATRGLEVEVVPEGQWIPEMATFRHLPGWYKHQLVKLAAAEAVTSPYYLTLDADVICTRPTTTAELLPGGKSACFVIERDEHPQWYEGAEAVLGVRAPRRGILHNVTPAVWAKEAVLELIEHLNGVATRRAYASGLRGLQQRLFFTLHKWGRHRRRAPWRAWLAASRPWAEYAMYFTLLEATGRFERYHFSSDYCIYDVDRSVWWKADFDAWDARPLFDGSGPPYFAVIQSNTQVPAERVWQKVAPWLGTREDPAVVT